MAWWSDSGISTGGIKPDQYHLREGLIELGKAQDGFDSYPTSDKDCIGVTSGGVTISIEQTHTDVEVDQMRFPIGGHITGYTMSVSTALSQFALRNIRLWLGTSSQMTHGQDGDADHSSVVLPIAAQPIPYVALKIIVPRPAYGDEQPMPSGKYREIELWKVKCFANGDITFSKTDPATIPVTFVAYANANDQVGRIVDRKIPSDNVSDVISVPWE